MRHIADEIFADEFFGSLAMEYRVLWIGLIAAVADDQGRFMDNAALIRSIVFPYDEKITIKVIDQGLTILAKAHKIVRYVAGTNGSGKRLIQIVNWWRYQHSTQWARESLHQAPPKWTDRIRIHKAGNGNVPYQLHWDSEGGYVQPMKALRSPDEGDRPIPRMKPIPTKKPTKRPPPSNPSSSKSSKRKREASQSLAGGGGEDDSTSSSVVDQKLEEIFKQNPAARETARIMKPILTADGLGKQKFNNLMGIVAIRILPSKAKQTALAAIASAYADETAINKPIVTAHRLENEQVPAKFMNPATWTVIPENILHKAGINDLNDYIASNGNGHNLSSKIASLRARAHTA